VQPTPWADTSNCGGGSAGLSEADTDDWRLWGRVLPVGRRAGSEGARSSVSSPVPGESIFISAQSEDASDAAN
jgi:hypothetical protein